MFVDRSPHGPSRPASASGTRSALRHRDQPFGRAGARATKPGGGAGAWRRLRVLRRPARRRGRACGVVSEHSRTSTGTQRPSGFRYSIPQSCISRGRCSCLKASHLYIDLDTADEAAETELEPGGTLPVVPRLPTPDRAHRRCLPGPPPAPGSFAAAGCESESRLHGRRDDPRVADVALALQAQTRYQQRTTFEELARDLAEPDVDEQLMYFWCHEGFNPTSPAPAPLAVRLTDQLPFDGDTVRALRQRSPAHRQFHPFVIINACQPGPQPRISTTPSSAVSSSTRRAGGAGHHRSAMPQAFAAEYAWAFITQYLSGRAGPRPQERSHTRSHSTSPRASAIPSASPTPCTATWTPAYSV